MGSDLPTIETRKSEIKTPPITIAKIAHLILDFVVSIIRENNTAMNPSVPQVRRCVIRLVCVAAAVFELKPGISQELRSELIATFTMTPRANLATGASVEARRDLWLSWIPEFRIHCLTESPAYSAMWFHYADKYSGAVLEFNCNDELDSAWLLAQRHRRLATEQNNGVFTP